MAAAASQIVVMEEARDGDLAQLYGAALALTMSAALVFAGIFLFRKGLEGTAADVTAIFLFAVLPAWLSALGLARSGAIAAAIGFFVGALLPVAGLYGVPYLALVAGVLVIVSAAVGLRSLWQALRSAPLALIVWSLLGAALLVTATEAWRLFVPEAMKLAIAIPDRYFHAAIAQMILHYGIPSFGIDGLVFKQYHFLSHFVVAGIARDTGAEVPLGYLYWGGYAIKLQMVWGAILAGMLLFRGGQETGSAIAARMAYAWLCAIFIGGLESESFVFGTGLLFALLPVLLALAQTGAGRRARDWCLLLLVAVLSVAVTAAKVSNGFFCVVALVVVAWRSRRNPAAVGMLGLMIAGLAWFAMHFIAQSDMGTGEYPLSMRILDYIHYFTLTTVLDFLIPVVVLVILSSRGQAVMRREEGGILVSLAQYVDVPASSAGVDARLRAGWQWLAGADALTQFLALSFAGCIAVVLTQSIGANLEFFSWILCASALLALPLAIRRAYGATVATRTLAWTLSLLALVVMLYQSLLFVFAEANTLPQVIIALYKASTDHYRPQEAGNGIRASLRQTHRLFTDLRARVDAAPVSRFAAALNAQARSVDGHIVVNVPAEATEVWHRLGGTSWWCFSGHLVVPAVTGVAQVRSLEPRAIEEQCLPPGVMATQGFGSNPEPHRAQDFDAGQLCALARPLQARKVYRLMSYKDLSQNRVIDCP